MRCARCGAEWAPIPYAAPDAVPEPVTIPPVPVATADAEAEPSLEMRVPLGFPAPAEPAGKVRASAFPWRGRQIAVTPLAAWVASVVLLVALVAAAYAWRGPIMAAWPPSERLYAALGLARAGEAGR